MLNCTRSLIRRHHVLIAVVVDIAGIGVLVFMFDTSLLALRFKRQQT